MKDEFKRIVEKGDKILADVPIYASKKDKINILNQKFRLGKDGCELILDCIEKKMKKRI